MLNALYLAAKVAKFSLTPKVSIILFFLVYVFLYLCSRKLLIQTDNDEIFGFIIQQSIKLNENVEYKSLPLSYLFTISPENKLYELKNQSDKVICFEPGAIRFGYGNDGPAITINLDLNEGITEKNSVFGDNICLIKNYDNDGFFNIKKLEIYLMQ